MVGGNQCEEIVEWAFEHPNRNEVGMAEISPIKESDVSKGISVQMSAFTKCKRMKVAPRVSRPF